MSKPFACRIGLHSWYGDSAFIHSVQRCNYCDKVSSKKAAAELDAERARIAALPSGASFSDLYRAALDLPILSLVRDDDK